MKDMGLADKLANYLIREFPEEMKKGDNAVNVAIGLLEEFKAKKFKFEVEFTKEAYDKLMEGGALVFESPMLKLTLRVPEDEQFSTSDRTTEKKS